MNFKNTTPESKPIKWEVIYEDEYSISTWKYNTKITSTGPVEVEYKYKKSYVHPTQKKKTLGELVKQKKGI